MSTACLGLSQETCWVPKQKESSGAFFNILCKCWINFSNTGLRSYLQVRERHLKNSCPSLVLVILWLRESHLRKRGKMILPHQEEVELLKTVILFLRLPASPPLHLERSRGLILCLKWLLTLSKLTSRFVSSDGVFRVLSAHLGAGLSVCRLVGGQQEWVLCERQ